MSHINISTLLQYRPPYPYPYRFPLRNLISSNGNPPYGFTVYRYAYYNILINQHGYNLNMNRISFVASILWKQEPANVKLYYRNLARKIRTSSIISGRRGRRNNDSRRIPQPSSSQQTSPVPPVPPALPAPAITLVPPVTQRNTSDIYIDFEELASHMNQGIPLPTTTTSVFNVSSSFGTSL
ncbi:unnamed protein product [Rhizophagus irregularis]|nr:unnamed protein product [Rhizophagus irregularis]